MKAFAKIIVKTAAVVSVALACSNSWAIPLTLTVGHGAGKVSSLNSQPNGGNVLNVYNGVFNDSHSTMPVMSFLSKHIVFGHNEGPSVSAPKAPPSTGNEPEGESGRGAQNRNLGALVQTADVADPGNPVPVPGTVALLGIGLVALSRGLRRGSR